MNLEIPFFESCVTGLELIITQEGDYLWNFVTIKKEKNKVQVIKSGSAIPDLEQLISILEPKFPVMLSVNGKGIIHKKTIRSEQDNFESLLVKILPSGKIEDFYIQVFSEYNSDAFVSIVRNGVLDGILVTLNSKGLKLIDCTLGPFSAQSFIPILDKAESSATLRVFGHELSIEKGVIRNYQPTTEDEGMNDLITIAGLEIKSRDIIAFGSAFAYFSPIHQITSNLNSLSEAKEDHKHELRFKTVGFAILISAFVALLINFLIFGYLTDQIKSKSSRFLLSNNKLALADSLAKQVDERTVFLAKSGLSQASRTSFYADQIAQNVPENISLTSINIEPLVKNDDDKKKLQFEPQKIIVTGKSHYALDVNEWIKSIKTKDWVDEVSLSNYKQKQNTDLGEFSLQIKMK